MSLRYPKLPADAWVRVCQECGHAQVTHKPGYKNEKWREFKCRHCHSAALDYGMINTELVEEFEE